MNTSRFNLSEIIGTAIQIRRKARSLYRQLARSARDEKLRGAFLALANWESCQGQAFESLLPAWASQQQPLGVEDERVEHFNDAARRLFARETKPVFLSARRPLDVLPLAVYMEEYIAFTFGNIRGFIADAAGKLAIGHILTHEARYIMFLNEQWSALEAGRPMALAPSSPKPAVPSTPAANTAFIFSDELSCQTS
jgi:hypothetical protein